MSIEKFKQTGLLKFPPEFKAKKAATERLNQRLNAGIQRELAAYEAGMAELWGGAAQAASTAPPAMPTETVSA